MKVVGKLSDRLLGYLVPKAKADALACQCNTSWPCGPGGLRSMLCCNGQCTCRC